jgi:hypothetical protein
VNTRCENARFDGTSPLKHSDLDKRNSILQALGSFFPFKHRGHNIENYRGVIENGSVHRVLMLEVG